MAQLLQFKRRNTGAAGAPTALKSGEPAYNAVDGKLYIGHGDDGNGNATAVNVLADPNAIPSNMATTTYVDGLVGGLTFLNLAGFAESDVAKLDASAFTASPTAPTPSQGDNSTKLCTTAYADTIKADLLGTVPDQLNSMQEVVAEIAANDTAIDAITAAAATKMAKANNLSDLPDAAVARTNLGVGSLATQAADAINVTGGTIGAGVTIAAPIDGGTF